MFEPATHGGVVAQWGAAQWGAAHMLWETTSHAHTQGEVVSVRTENDCLRKELQEVHTQLLKRHGLSTAPVPQSDGPALADSVAREAAERIARVQADANAAARKAAVQLAEAQRVHGSLREELEVLRGELHCRPTAAAHQCVFFGMWGERGTDTQ